MPRIGGVILAAGASSRMGRDKALLPWGGGTLLGAAIAALRPWTETVVVVAGANAAALAPVIAAQGATLVVNPAPERGQLSSLQVGLRAVAAAGCEAALITPVDCVPLGRASLECLRAEAARGGWAAVPEHGGRRGHPLAAGRELIAALLGAPASGSARDVVQRHAERVVTLAVEEELEDFDTPEQYDAALKR